MRKKDKTKTTSLFTVIVIVTVVNAVVIVVDYLQLKSCMYA